MIYNIVVTKKAQKEAFQAYLYYEEKQEGLGDRFIDKLEDRYFQLSENPQHYSFIYRDKGRNLRDIKNREFPFCHHLRNRG
jgi:hypothetical protein